ncbi:ornithine carbamoyltransferase [Coemansia biformis]|uniref:ornithine carbamoyltransferase n=1 Tax=Coemansia biformis TaxID=1286918 RepID=A0A9W7YEP6_9FUNG|nr:ornithine carbamoyltransferase [Coemansia biformis]
MFRLRPFRTVWQPMFRVTPSVVAAEGGSKRLKHAGPLGGLPRDMISLGDYSAEQIVGLVESAAEFKHKTKQLGQAFHPDQPLRGKTIGLLFSKRSTRTRVASETSIAYLGGHPLFLGKDDIQLGVNESLRDSAQVISSMVDGIFARVGPHTDITTMAKHSSVPVVNALCDENHPTQILADLLTIWEVFGSRKPEARSASDVFRGLRVAWVGDSNNIVYEMLAAMPKCGISMSVCTPEKYPVPEPMRQRAAADAQTAGAEVSYCSDPLRAVNGADIIVTDTWVSMGFEAEKAQRLREFDGFQVSSDMARQGGANKDWVFMHCLPRKPEEVTDEVFYSDRSVVFQEAENRKWTILAVFNALFGKRQ